MPGNEQTFSLVDNTGENVLTRPPQTATVMFQATHAQLDHSGGLTCGFWHLLQEEHSIARHAVCMYSAVPSSAQVTAEYR